ncbi:uncharacterized protein LOC131666271 [Phymastichus coffea]|uniref:uncharacterized protein LOC131666271 n=1 Tax=Phymastichus coffea TaxID=108790 RepID=UPI00273BA5C2|nr:uncharacterized protein LOC131666271 [Phymastichus coffea]XP_058794770.1 uncharacterized protein LOC131666271 [Phymastichus coffea]
MDQVNGTTPPKKKQVLFSIGSYSERDKRVINKISTNGLFASATTDDVAAMHSQPTRTLPKTRPVSLNFLDSTTKYRTLPARHRYNDELAIEKPVCPPSSACNSPAVENGPIAGKPSFPPKLAERSLSLEPEQLRHSGRVALTIAAYEGAPRTPTRLDFLPPGRVSRSSSKTSSSTPSTPGEDVDGSRMMLQNELAATLKRSNLKKLTEDDVLQENGTSDLPLDISQPVEKEKPNSKREIETSENAETTNVFEKELQKIKSEEALKCVNSTETPENIKITEESKNNENTKEVEGSEDKQQIKEEIDAALTKLENSTEESGIIPVPPPMPEAGRSTVKKTSQAADEETGETIKETIEIVESKDEIDVTPNGSVKQLAIELGKKMTFKADIERVPEQNGIEDK